MNYQIYFTKEAEDSFNSICEQIKGRFGEKESEKFKQLAFKALDNLQYSPFVYPFASEKHPQLRKYIFQKTVLSIIKYLTARQYI